MKAAKHFSVTEKSTLCTLCFPFGWMGCSQLFPFLCPFPCPSSGNSCLFRGEQPLTLYHECERLSSDTG